MEAFGWKGLLLAPLMTIGPLVEFFHSELNALGDQFNDRDKYQILVRRFAPGTVTTYEVADNSPNEITAGPDGNLWFTEETGNQIGRITPGGQFTEFPLPTTGSYPKGITAGPDGNLWFVEGSNRIGQITPGGQITEFPLPTANSLPYGITAGPDGNLWFTEFGSNQIGQITPAGQITEFPLPTTGNEPEGITAGSDGALWFAERTVDSRGLLSGSKIGRITPAGQITEFQLSTTYSGLDPIPITAGPDGNLWFTEGAVYSIGINNVLLSGAKIGRITPGGSITFPVSNSQGYDLVNLSGITVGHDGNLWFTGQTSKGHGIILRITL